MELRHLIYFKAVAEELHFKKAAAKLFISQPPLSRQIKEMEEEMGVQLFIRNNKRVILTDAGVYFKQEVDHLLSGLEASKNIARSIHSSDSGELKIGYISSVYQAELAAVLKEMQHVFPYLKTSLYELPTIKQIEALELGKLDIGILRAPVHSEKLIQKTLFFDPFVIVIPHGKTGTAGEIFEYIKDQPFVFFNQSYAPFYYGQLIDICYRLGFKPDIRHEVNNVHSILQLVEAGLGVSILPKSLKYQSPFPNLSFIELDNISIRTEVVLAYKKSSYKQAVKWFVDQYAAVAQKN